MLIYASGKRTEQYIYLELLSLSLWIGVLHQLKNGINLQNRHQMLNREGEKGPYLSCSFNGG